MALLSLVAWDGSCDSRESVRGLPPTLALEGPGGGPPLLMREQGGGSRPLFCVVVIVPGQAGWAAHALSPSSASHSFRV